MNPAVSQQLTQKGAKFRGIISPNLPVQSFLPYKKGFALANGVFYRKSDDAFFATKFGKSAIHPNTTFKTGNAVESNEGMEDLVYSFFAAGP